MIQWIIQASVGLKYLVNMKSVESKAGRNFEFFISPLPTTTTATTQPLHIHLRVLVPYFNTNKKNKNWSKMATNQLIYEAVTAQWKNIIESRG